VSFAVASVAARLLAARSGGDAVQPDEPGPDLRAAYEVQDAVALTLGGVAGWKGGPADPASAVRASPIMAGTVLPSPARFDGATFRIIGVEPEIAFVLARGFEAGATPTEAAILDAVDSAHVAIEVCDTRIDPWRDADPLWKLADCQANRGLVLGTAIPGWRALDMEAQHAVLTADASLIGEGRSTPGGDPRKVLVAVVQHLCTVRGGVAARAAITTGSWCGLVEVSAGAEVVAAFDGLGHAVARF
jgi:2-keto-4-pentenoate hydratase